MLAPSNRRELPALTRAPEMAAASRVRGEGHHRADLGQDARGSDGLRMGGLCRGDYMLVGFLDWDNIAAVGTYPSLP